MFSLLVGIVLSRVRVCSSRPLVLKSLGAVGVVTPHGTCAWLWRGTEVGARTRARGHVRKIVLALLVGVKVQPAEVADLSHVADCGVGARPSLPFVFDWIVLVVSLVVVVGFGVYGNARAPARLPACFARWASPLSLVVSLFVRVNGCRSLALVPSGWRRGLVAQFFGVASGAVGDSSLALVCSLCSLGRSSWCGLSWVIIAVVCARPRPPPAIARVVRWERRRSCLVTRAARVPARVPLLLCGCGMCTRSAVWSLE